jgi:DNA-binding transcriptional LysR family regulator
LGKILFERSGNRLVATEEALVLDKALDPLFESLMRIHESNFVEEITPPLRLAAPPAIAHRFLQDQLVQFVRQQPSAKISFEVTASNNLVTGVADGQFDLGLTDAYAEYSGVTHHPLCTTNLVCAMPADHALTAKSVIQADDLAGLPLIGLPRRQITRTLTESTFAKAGLEPHFVIETATAVSIWHFVGAGLGLALVNPFPLALTPDSQVAVRPFDPSISRVTSFLTTANQPLSSTARRFMRFVRINMPNEILHQKIEP